MAIYIMIERRRLHEKAMTFCKQVKNSVREFLNFQGWRLGEVGLSELGSSPFYRPI
jgi:hypothetical protein